VIAYVAVRIAYVTLLDLFFVEYGRLQGKRSSQALESLASYGE
jgi:hypothetical protein